MRRRSVLAGIAVGALLSLAAWVPVGAATTPQPLCDGQPLPRFASAQPNTTLTQMLQRYGNASTSDTWSGADSTYSVDLPGGRELWLFSDTFLGPVHPDGSRDSTVPFIHNSFILQRGDQLTTMHGGTATSPTSLLSPPDPNSWYWANATLLVPGAIDVIYLEFQQTGTGIFDFAFKRSVLARFSPSDLHLIDLHDLPSSVPNLEWNPWLLQQGGYTYIYGVEDLSFEQQPKYMHLARVRGDDLLGQWQFYTGSGWSRNERDSARMLQDVSNTFSVTRLGSWYALIDQDTSFPFGNQIDAYFSCSPAGPFIGKTHVYQTPEAGIYGTYHNQNVITYDPHAHPELQRGGQMVISYDVNSLDTHDVLRDVSIYRSRFVDLQFSDG